MSKTNRRERVKAALEPKEAKTPKFILMPREFGDGMRQMVMQQRATVQLKLSTALELNPHIPKNWTYNVDKGGFEPLPEEKGD